MQLTDQEIEEIVGRVLEEDAALRDVTTQAIVPKDAELRLRMATRQLAVIAGLPVAAAIVRRMTPQANIDLLIKDGEEVDAGTVLARFYGAAHGLLAAERAALNVVQHLSGIATLTRAYVRQIEGTGAVLRDTRKTLPGLRRLEKYASSLGGAQNHRPDLASGALIKDNHLTAAGGLAEAVRRAKRANLAPIEVECENLDQIHEAMTAGADILLLDNMSLKALRTAVSNVSGQVKLEASGGVSLDKIRAIAETGVDFISVGKITHSAPAIDVGLDLDS
ncbi:MAG: carboxylating nicotinate-nucleotide diphosphorylase [Alphaproteobacteria bacterium]|nr:carboxylating nicotinate-nucleotide diphosphorylase [Alphaproteobacteria bacterium]